MSARAGRGAFFIDTSAFFALADPTDQHFNEAILIWMEFRARPWIRLTSNFVLAEFHALAVNRCGPRVALQAIEIILAGRATVVDANEDDQRRALAIVRTRVDKGYSMVDAISFAIMERLNVSTAFTFDRHFVQHGFRVLSLEQ